MMTYSSSRITHNNRRARRVVILGHQRLTRSHQDNHPGVSCSRELFPHGIPQALLSLVDHNPSGPRDPAPAAIYPEANHFHTRVIDLTEDDDDGNQTEDDGVQDASPVYPSSAEALPNIVHGWPCVEAGCNNEIDQSCSFFHCTAHWRSFSQMYPRRDVPSRGGWGQPSQTAGQNIIQPRQE